MRPWIKNLTGMEAEGDLHELAICAVDKIRFSAVEGPHLLTHQRPAAPSPFHQVVINHGMGHPIIAGPRGTAFFNFFGSHVIRQRSRTCDFDAVTEHFKHH